MKQQKAGFSLVEILIALVIIAILGAYVGLNLLGQTDEARVTAAKGQIVTLSAALNLYKAQQGQLPTQQQGLQALVEASTQNPVPKRFPEGGYLDSTTVPVDPWENPYGYLIPGRKGEAFEIISYGADGELGGEGYDADLSSRDS